jgi:hypothetical protein
LDLHLDLASSRGREGYEFLSAADISSWGAPATGAVELARSVNASLKTKLAGFSR